MSILKYCKRTLSLPNLNGPLSDKISSKAIELTNAEVEKVSHLSKEQAGKKALSSRLTPYLLLSIYLPLIMSMHHKHMTVTTYLPRFFLPIISLMPNRQCFFCQGSLQWNLPMFSTANVSRYTVCRSSRWYWHSSGISGHHLLYNCSQRIGQSTNIKICHHTILHTIIAVEGGTFPVVT